MVTKTLPMELLEQKGIPYEAHHHKEDQYTAEGVAQDLGVPVAQVVKAMLVRCDGSWYVLVVVPGDRRLGLERVRTMVGAGKVNLASKQEVERITGYTVGAVSVMGFRQGGVLTFVDRGVLDLEQVIISSGRPDAGLALSPENLLAALEGAQIGEFTE
ncbi:MAG: YbaK/EbsC family protein [Anaerolineae bacterium]|jgi:Cys-tRNA(Pro)/Cys-tRNA(Cys) deacylase